MDVPWNQTHVFVGALVGGLQINISTECNKDLCYTTKFAVNPNAGLLIAAAGLYYYFGDMKQ